MFYIGQKVVCVDDCAGPFGIAIGRLKRGHVYQIENIYSGFGRIADGVLGEGCGFQLVGVSTPSERDFFRSTRFRPAVERKTSIEIFERLLDPTKHEKEIA